MYTLSWSMFKLTWKPLSTPFTRKLIFFTSIWPSSTLLKASRWKQPTIPATRHSLFSRRLIGKRESGVGRGTPQEGSSREATFLIKSTPLSLRAHTNQPSLKRSCRPFRMLTRSREERDSAQRFTRARGRFPERDCGAYSRRRDRSTDSSARHLRFLTGRSLPTSYSA